MFAFVLDSAMSNAYLLYCTQWDQADDTRRGNKKDRTDFHCAVVRGLCVPLKVFAIDAARDSGSIWRAFCTVWQ